MGGIQIIPETNQVISPRYGTLNNMIAIGQVTNGVNKLRNGVKTHRRSSGQFCKLFI